MSRYLLAGLFVLSLTICAGCGGDTGPAIAPDEDVKAGNSSISGMGDDKTDDGGAGKLPPPPPLPPIPPGNQ